jgi:dimethylhistidine N-methyltransferase
MEPLTGLQSKPRMTSSSELAWDVRLGLAESPKRLPPRLFYDAEGSRLFEEITELPEYYVTRTERMLFQRHGEEMVTQAGERVDLVELGVGSGNKTLVLLEALIRRQGEARFFPIDVSAAALRMAADAAKARFPDLTVSPLEGRYEAALPRLKSLANPKLVLFIGSSIGNFDATERVALLRKLRLTLREGDALLLGTDLRKPASILIPAYDDAQGVTAQFNKNVLARINRELGGQFDLSRFHHRIEWNSAASRIEMHLESEGQQSVYIQALDWTVHFAPSERIHTENSYKFTPQMVEDMLSMSGFSLERTWTDENDWYAEHLARAVSM